MYIVACRYTYHGMGLLSVYTRVGCTREPTGITVCMCSCIYAISCDKHWYFAGRVCMRGLPSVCCGCMRVCKWLMCGCMIVHVRKFLCSPLLVSLLVSVGVVVSSPSFPRIIRIMFSTFPCLGLLRVHHARVLCGVCVVHICGVLVGRLGVACVFYALCRVSVAWQVCCAECT